MFFRTPGPWGPGEGANLTATQFDANNWQLLGLINEKAVAGVGIASLSVVGDELYVTLTDHSILGPYMLPVTTISFKGAWAPLTQYYTNQILTANGSTYIVTANHISAATFDPGANDGHGNNYYGLLLSNPANTLPTGGATGMLLEKASGADLDILWAWPTLAGLHDVLQSPAPLSGELVYWNGSAFSYITQADVRGAPPAFTDLSDVSPSPGPTTGFLVYWNGSAFSYINPLDLPITAPPGTFQTLGDVLHSPAPNYGQIVWWQGSYFTYEDVTTSLFQDWHITSLAQWDLMYYDAANVRWQNRQPLIYNSGWSGTFTLDLSMAQNVMDIATGGNITVPAQATIAFAKSTAIWIRQGGALSSPFALIPDAGVTINKPPGRIAQPRAQGSIVMLQQTSTIDTWVLSGDLAFDSTVAIPGSGTWNLDDRIDDQPVFKWTPTGNNTVNVVSGGAPFGREMTFVITTSGTSSFTLTFGTRFKSQGTLATGVVSGAVFVIKFVGDGTNFNEISRTTAM